METDDIVVNNNNNNNLISLFSTVGVKTCVHNTTHTGVFRTRLVFARHHNYDVVIEK